MSNFQPPYPPGVGSGGGITSRRPQAPSAGVGVGSGGITSRRPQAPRPQAPRPQAPRPQQSPQPRPSPPSPRNNNVPSSSSLSSARTAVPTSTIGGGGGGGGGGSNGGYGASFYSAQAQAANNTSFLPKSEESYGQVHSASQSSLSQRRTGATQEQQKQAPTKYYYGGAHAQAQSYSHNTTASVSQPFPSSVSTSSTASYISGTNANTKKMLYYQHNYISLPFLLLPLLCILSRHEAPYPLQVLLFLSLVLYAFDLSNLPYLLEGTIWVALFIFSMITGWFTLIDEGDDDGQVLVLELMARITVQIFFLSCWACYISLQFKWLHHEKPESALSYEQFLHAILPLTSAGIVSFGLSTLLASEEGGYGIEQMATLTPYLFACILAIGMLFLGCCESSFHEKEEEESTTSNYEKTPSTTTTTTGTTKYAITTRLSKVHTISLLVIPPTMHLTTFFHRFVDKYTTMDDWWDLILVCCVPYLICYGIHILFTSDIWEGPYNQSNILFPTKSLLSGGTNNNSYSNPNTIKGSLIPINITILASLALQNRYLIPICHEITYKFQGHNVPSGFVVSNYLSLATAAIWFSIWIWGRRSSVNDQLLFGEYQEDIVQLCFAFSGFFVGMALGLPWSLIPLPLLASLGLALWVTTYLMRYLSIFLFVVHSSGVVLFGYRYAGMDMKIKFAVPGISFTLVQFSCFIVATSVFAGVIAGLSVRSNGGYGAAYMKKLDITGKCLILYSILVTALECTLLTQPVPKKELSGIEIDITEVENFEMLYDHEVAFATSAILIAIAVFLKKQKSISPFASIIVISCAIGKAIAVFIDYSEDYTSIYDMAEEDDDLADNMLFQAISTMALIGTIAAPKYFLKPMHVKASIRSRRSYFSSGRTVDIPKNAQRKIIFYAGFLLPTTLLVSLSYVFFPVMKVFTNDYYNSAPPASDLIGYGFSIWGLSCLNMLNYYLPDGGADIWKKSSAATFLMGIGMIFAAPSIPRWIFTGINSSAPESNPYANISSLGYQIINRGKSRSGGWGLLSASLATLLAVTGPLELRERKGSANGSKKDTFFLPRLMIFSVLFGCGVAWFVMVQSMSEEHLLVLIVCSISSLAISFFGTITSVLGYFLDIESFEEVEQVAEVFMLAFPILIVMSALPQLFVPTGHLFGTGGWLATYLIICTLNLMAFTLILRARATKNKTTRGLGNASCITAWGCVITILYGRYGISGLDEDFTMNTLLGMPISVFGTVLASLLLLFLEGEGPERRSDRIRKISNTKSNNNSNYGSISWGINFKRLNKATALVPLFVSTVVVLLLASLYGITLRGLFSPASNGKPSNIIKNVDPFAPTNLGMLAFNTILNDSVIVSAKLAYSGYFTSSSFFGPTLHLVGVFSVVPSLYYCITYFWLAKPEASKKSLTFVLPLNIIPMFLCKSIPSLRAASLLCTVAGLYQLWSFRNRNWESNMRL